MPRTHRLSIVAVFALVLVACGGDNGDAVPSGDTVTVVTSEFEFEPDLVTIAADTDTIFVLDNSGGLIEHDWTIDALGIHVSANATQTVTTTINVPAGTYDVYCSVPGHREAGMLGVLVAQ